MALCCDRASEQPGSRHGSSLIPDVRRFSKEGHELSADEGEYEVPESPWKGPKSMTTLSWSCEKTSSKPSNKVEFVSSAVNFSGQHSFRNMSNSVGFGKSSTSFSMRKAVSTGHVGSSPESWTSPKYGSSRSCVAVRRFEGSSRIIFSSMSRPIKRRKNFSANAILNR